MPDFKSNILFSLGRSQNISFPYPFPSWRLCQVWNRVSEPVRNAYWSLAQREILKSWGLHVLESPVKFLSEGDEQVSLHREENRKSFSIGKWDRKCSTDHLYTLTSYATNKKKLWYVIKKQWTVEKIKRFFSLYL